MEENNTIRRWDFNVETDSTYPKTEFYVGPAESGKTRMAKELSEGKKVFYTSFRGKKTYSFESMQAVFTQLVGDEEMIILDDIPARGVPVLLDYFLSPELYIDRKGKPTIRFRRPHMIIIIDGEFEMPNQATYTRRYSVVKFPEAAPAHWTLKLELDMLPDLMSKSLHELTEQELKGLAFIASVNITKYAKREHEVSFTMENAGNAAFVEYNKGTNYISIGRKKRRDGMSGLTSFGGNKSFTDVVTLFRCFMYIHFEVTMSGPEKRKVYTLEEWKPVWKYVFDKAVGGSQS